MVLDSPLEITCKIISCKIQKITSSFEALKIYRSPDILMLVEYRPVLSRRFNTKRIDPAKPASLTTSGVGCLAKSFSSLSAWLIKSDADLDFCSDDGFSLLEIEILIFANANNWPIFS